MEQNLKEVKEKVTLRKPEERVFQVRKQGKDPKDRLFGTEKKKPVWL